MKLLSVVFSFRNEEGNIEPLVKRIASTMKKIVAGKKLWNYDNLEPTEKKGAI